MRKERPGALLARRTCTMKGMEGHPHWSCAPGTEEGMEPDDLLSSRNAPGFVCLVGWSVWSVWFFWMSFRFKKPDRRDRPSLLLARPASLARLALPSVDTRSGRPSSQPSRGKVSRSRLRFILFEWFHLVVSVLIFGDRNDISAPHKGRQKR